MGIMKQKKTVNEILNELEDMDLEYKSGSSDSLRGEIQIGCEKSLHKGESYDQTTYHLVLEAVEIEDKEFLWYINIIGKNDIMGEYRIFEDETDHTMIISRNSFGQVYVGDMPTDFTDEIKDVLEHVEY